MSWNKSSLNRKLLTNQQYPITIISWMSLYEIKSSLHYQQKNRSEPLLSYDCTGIVISAQNKCRYLSLKFHSIVVAGKVNRLSGKIKRWLFNSGLVIRVRVLYKPSSIHIFVIISLYLIILFIYVFHVKFGESWLENLMIACLVCSSRALFLPLYCNQPTRLSRKKKKYESVCVCRTYDWASYIAGKRQKKYILENLHIRQSFSFLDTVYSSTHRDTSSIFFFSPTSTSLGPVCLW